MQGWKGLGRVDWVLELARLGFLNSRFRPDERLHLASRPGDKDRRCLWVALPGEVLPDGGLQVLHHMEAGVLAQERMAQGAQ